MSTIVLVLSMLVLYIFNCQTTTVLTCDQLPKLQMHSIEVLVANGPFTTDFTFQSLHECAVRLFSHPVRGSTNYNGSFIQIKGSKAVMHDYHFNSDTKTGVLTTCDTGEEFTGHVLAAQFNKSGSFFCTYRCDDKLLKGFLCASNNNGASPAELEAVELARNVSNGHLIHDARENCPPSKGCKLFY